MIDHLDHLDHLVLTTVHEADCIRFYTQALGMRLETLRPKGSGSISLCRLRII